MATGDERLSASPIGRTVEQVFGTDRMIKKVLPLRATDEAILKWGGDPSAHPLDEFGMRVIGGDSC